MTSHADADHIGGHAAVIEHFETEGEGVGAVFDPGIAPSSQTYDDYLDAVETHDVSLYEARVGDPIPMAGVDAEVLAPPRRHLAGGDRNENSVVLRLAFGNTAFLLPGDGETEEERTVAATQLPEDGRHVDAVLRVELRDGAVVDASDEPGESERRSDRAQRRFDELSSRPPSADDTDPGSELSN